ncbi:MAG: VOC family protein [Alphaproteobacteria bacterium]|nr:VOC family protein [Alphaproteobacteria bacterium]
MSITTCHFGMHVHSLDAAREFYVGILKLSVLQDLPQIKLLALKAGDVRLSIRADVSMSEAEAASRAGGSIIFRTANLAETVSALQRSGVAVPPVSEAPGFMKFVTLRDPSGNLVQIAEYMRDPLREA